MSNVESKVIARVRKLLALAADGGATQAEAELAAERAREMMAEHGLSTATVEASGGEGERRADEKFSGGAGEWWQPPLMEAIAETCFVHAERTYRRDEAGRQLGEGYRLIGRESAVAACRVLYEYLCQTVRRACREADPPPPKPKWFRRGMSERLQERVRDRHRQAMREQRRRAEEERERRGGSTARALVVVLEDYAETEREANDEIRRGLPPGSLAREREEQEQRRRDRLATYERLIAEGLSTEIANWMSWGYSRERAEELASDRSEQKPKTEREREQDRRRDERWRSRQQARHEREMRKRGSASWSAGRRSAESVGLEQQVDRGAESRRLK